MRAMNLIGPTCEPPHLQAGPQRWSRAERRPRATWRAALALACGLVGCASVPQGRAPDPRDHMERFNRSVYQFNTALDRAILRPVARGYVKITPRPVRAGISNFLGNLEYTKTIANDIFQAQFVDFGSDVARLVINTTVGIGGVFDPATRFRLEKHERDFGQTLGKWGVPTGPYLMLPILGPSDVRDGLGFVADRFMSVDGSINDPVIAGSLTAAGRIDGRAKLMPFDRAIDTAYDPYALVRSVWFQRREHKVHGDSGFAVLTADPDDE
jgi:phospholipid-binding lipoprotein MlaA